MLVVLCWYCKSLNFSTNIGFAVHSYFIYTNGFVIVMDKYVCMGIRATTNTVDGERFAGLNIRGFSAIEVFTSKLTLRKL